MKTLDRFGIGLTGHYLAEGGLLDQTLTSGAVMPLYEYEQYPGIDHLCRQNRETLASSR